MDMIFARNTKSKETDRKIEALIGKQYSFRERLKLKGTGSMRMKVIKTSPGLSKTQDKNDINYTSIELRPKGMIAYFRTKINNYIWVIPYYKLSVFQSETFNIHADGEYIRLDLKTVYPKNKKFFDRMFRLKEAVAQ